MMSSSSSSDSDSKSPATQHAAAPSPESSSPANRLMRSKVRPAKRKSPESNGPGDDVSSSSIHQGRRRRKSCRQMMRALRSDSDGFGKWAADEHQRFVEAMDRFGNSWKDVMQYIGTRTPAQIRSHAQKYYKHLRLQKMKEMKSDPKQKNAVFVITKEYLNRTTTTARTTQFIDSPFMSKHESSSNVPSAGQTQITNEEHKDTMARLGSVVVPLPCYPIYMQSIPSDFKWVSTSAGKISPPIYSNQLARCVIAASQGPQTHK